MFREISWCLLVAGVLFLGGGEGLAQEGATKNAFGFGRDEGEIRQTTEEEQLQAREDRRPIPKCEKHARDQIQILASDLPHHQFVQLIPDGQGRLKGRGWEYRTAFAGDLRKKKDYDHFHCEAVRGVHRYSSDITVFCVGAFIDFDEDFAGRKPYYYPAAFGLGPCAEEEHQEMGRLCRFGVRYTGGEPRDPNVEHPLVKMMKTKTIDFKLIATPEGKDEYRPIEERLLSVRGRVDLLQRTESLVLRKPDSDSKKLAPKLVPESGWQFVAVKRGPQAGIAAEEEVRKILNHYNQSCGWIGFTANRPKSGGPIYVAFGEGGMEPEFEGKIPSAIQKHRGVAKYDPESEMFRVIYHRDEEKRGKEYSYVDFICDIMCYRRGGDIAAITDPLRCRE